MYKLKEFRKANNLTQAAVAEMFSCKQSNIVAIEKDSKDLTADQYTILIEKFGEEFVMSFQTDASQDIHERTIKYFDIDASAGKIEMFDPGNGSVYKDVIIPGFGDCEIALNVWGDSMEPTLNAGEIILCKEWTENFIEYGHVYLIVTKKNNRMIKYLQPGNNNDTVMCESENDYYKPFEVAREEIYKLFKIKGHIARNEI